MLPERHHPLLKKHNHRGIGWAFITGGAYAYIEMQHSEKDVREF